MTIPDFTTIIAVDAEHLTELRIVWPTWQAFKPEIMERPLLVVVDARDAAEYVLENPADKTTLRPVGWPEALDFLGHPLCRIIPWTWPHRDQQWLVPVTQRERMLTAFVYCAQYISIPYYLKIDTDVVASRPGQWIDPGWFKNDPVFVSSPWRYTKPADAIQRLDDWGDGVPGLVAHPRLNLLPKPGWSRLMHPRKRRRTISYVYFGRTDWTQEMASLAPDRLPVPSQDTFLWYCAERRGDPYRLVRMGKFGWKHLTGLGKLRRVAAEALVKHGLGRRAA